MPVFDRVLGLRLQDQIVDPPVKRVTVCKSHHAAFRDRAVVLLPFNDVLHPPDVGLRDFLPVIGVGAWPVSVAVPQSDSADRGASIVGQVSRLEGGPPAGSLSLRAHELVPGLPLIGRDGSLLKAPREAAVQLVPVVVVLHLVLGEAGAKAGIE